MKVDFINQIVKLSLRTKILFPHIVQLEIICLIYVEADCHILYVFKFHVLYTTVKKCRVIMIFFKWSFIQQRHFNLIIHDSKDIDDVTKDLYFKKCCSFEDYIHDFFFFFKFSTLIKFCNVSWVPNQHVNTKYFAITWIHCILKYIKIETSYFKFK